MGKLLIMIGIVLMMISCNVSKVEQPNNKYLLLSMFDTVQECLDSAKVNSDKVLFDICYFADTVYVPKNIEIVGIKNIFADTIIYEKIN